MSKKHWIYIKRGLSEDPKHRAAMGECIWLYMHIIDRADWEMGIAYDWKDSQEAADMGMPVDTMRRQRQKLEELDYIRCQQKQHSQDIKIMEWRNPREYDSQVRNPRVRTDDQSEESKGDNQGDNQGLNEGQAQVKTPSSDSKSKNSKSKAPAARPLDILDGILHYQLQPKAIQDALKTYFRLTPNWETKTSHQFMERAIELEITPEQIQYAADVWRNDKRFNWSPATLKGISEHWLELVDGKPQSQTQKKSEYQAL